MKSFLTIMIPAALIGAVIAAFAPSVGFEVNRIGLIAGFLAAGLLIWIVWHGVPAASVEWPGNQVEPARRSVSEWALETLLTNALRGSERSLRELSRLFGDLIEGRGDVSPALAEFVTAGREGRRVPRLNRRELHNFLKEIAS